jgi:hypothetical protein
MDWEPTQWKQTTPSVSLTAVSHICRCPPCNTLESRQRQETSYFRVRVRAIDDHQRENEEELEEDSEFDIEGNHKAKGIKYPYILGPIADTVFESHYLPGLHLEGTIRGEPMGPFVGSSDSGCTYSSPESTDSELEDPQLFPISPSQASTPFPIPACSFQYLPAASLPETRRSSPLRQERFNFEGSAEDGPVMNPFGITSQRNLPRGNEKTKEHSWFQELAALNALFSALPAFNTVVESDVQDEDAPENAMNFPVDPIAPSVPYITDGEGDADEEDNVVKISRELEDVRLAEENEWLEEGSSHATGEGGDADDDDDSNFELGEEGYVFVNGNGQSDTGGSWSREEREQTSFFS